MDPLIISLPLGCCCRLQSVHRFLQCIGGGWVVVVWVEGDVDKVTLSLLLLP
jgi:hypothetical protein